MNETNDSEDFHANFELMSEAYQQQQNNVNMPKSSWERMSKTQQKMRLIKLFFKEVNGYAQNLRGKYSGISRNIKFLHAVKLAVNQPQNFALLYKDHIIYIFKSEEE